MKVSELIAQLQSLPQDAELKAHYSLVDHMQPIIICTEKKGVFVGLCDDPLADPQYLYDGQMVVEWSEETHGVMGIASRGPMKGSKVGPPVPCLIHAKNEITCVVDMTQEALKRCLEEPWG